MNHSLNFVSSHPCHALHSTWVPARSLTRHSRTWSKLKTRQARAQTPRGIPRAAATDKPPSTPIPLAPPTSDIWELDFYSRPVVGLDGKKLWELIIVDSTGNFEFVEAVPNTLVNSRELRKRVESAMEASTRKPITIRFFRSQMFNMIQIALSELDVAVAPSRKTYALYRVLKQRETTVYQNMPGYKASLSTAKNLSSSTSSSSFANFNFSVSQRLPDALRCDKFAFASFPLGHLKEFFDEADPGDYYGDACPVDDDLDDMLPIPGIVVFSKRAAALAAWISGIELVFVKAMRDKREVVFECGLNNVYRFAQISDDIKEDVRNFQKLKDAADGLHFLAVQEGPDAEDVEGMWLMCEL